MRGEISIPIAPLLLAAIALAPGPSHAAPQDEYGAPDVEFLRPLNLFQLSPEIRTAPGAGATDSDLRTVTNDIVTLRMDRKFELSPQWTLGLRTDVPFVAKNPLNSDNPNGDFVAGIGDIDAQAALVRNFDERWRVGAGVRFYAPTGGDLIGSGKWQIMPGAAVRYALPEIGDSSYFEPFLRYAASFGGDPSRRTISNLQFAPTLNIGLPDRWYLVFYPSADIRINYGDPITGQTGRLFLPFDAKIGRKIFDNLSVSLEVGVPIVKDYPVYSFKTVLYVDFRY